MTILIDMHRKQKSERFMIQRKQRISGFKGKFKHSFHDQLKSLDCK